MRYPLLPKGPYVMQVAKLEPGHSTRTTNPLILMTLRLCNTDAGVNVFLSPRHPAMWRDIAQDYQGLMQTLHNFYVVQLKQTRYQGQARSQVEAFLVQCWPGAPMPESWRTPRPTETPGLRHLPFGGTLWAGMPE